MLTDSEIKKAITNGHFLTDEGKHVTQKLDGDNLWLEIVASGKACWRLRFIRPLHARPTRMSLGIYPATSLKRARQKAHDARTLLDANKDPIEERQKEKDAARAKRTFEEVIREWFAAFHESDATRSAKTRSNDLRKRDQLIELFGSKLIASITTTDIQQALIKIANGDGHKAKARQLRSMLREVFQYAMPNKYCGDNPAATALFKLPKINEQQLPAIIAPRQVGELMRRVRVFDGRMLVRAALEMMALTFPRPSNIAAMEWAEIDGNTWTIPKHKMKMRRSHRVPLSRQALAILEAVQPLTGNGKYVFSTGNKPIATKTLNRALRQIGYSDEQHCMHGFRSTASTLLNNEYRWPKDLIELQLAHGDEDKIRATYNRMAELDALLADEQNADTLDRQWEVRCKMMQHWSDRLDELARDDSGSNIVPLIRAA
jgi:integrase